MHLVSLDHSEGADDEITNLSSNEEAHNDSQEEVAVVGLLLFFLALAYPDPKIFLDVEVVESGDH